MLMNKKQLNVKSCVRVAYSALIGRLLNGSVRSAVSVKLKSVVGMATIDETNGQRRVFPTVIRIQGPINWSIRSSMSFWKVQSFSITKRQLAFERNWLSPSTSLGISIPVINQFHPILVIIVALVLVIVVLELVIVVLELVIVVLELVIVVLVVVRVVEVVVLVVIRVVEVVVLVVIVLLVVVKVVKVVVLVVLVAKIVVLVVVIVVLE